MTTNKFPWALLVGIVALVIACVAFYTAHNGKIFGGTTNYDTLALSGLQVGANCNNGFGTCQGQLESSFNFGTTTLVGLGSNEYQITASTTKNFDLVCPNVTPADQVEAFFAPTTTVSVNGEGWGIRYAQASSTSGFCTVTVSNDSGVTATIPQGLASTTGYRALH